MSSRRFLSQFILFMICVAGMNVIIARLAKNSVPRQVIRRAQEAAPANDVFLGNSLMAAGLDESAVESADPSSRPLNLGLGSTSPVEHLILYRTTADRHPARRIYYGFFDDQLTGTPKGHWNDLVGNRAMAYYMDPETSARLYAPDDPLQNFQIRTVGIAPMLTERQTIWSKVERIRRQIGGFGLPIETANRFGRSEDFGLLEAKDADLFARDRENDVANKVQFSVPINELIVSIRERGATPVLVLMPMLQSHRKRFYSTVGWSSYRNLLAERAQVSGAMMIDASDWIPDNGFADPLHLGPSGAKAFSTQLAATPITSPITR